MNHLNLDGAAGFALDILTLNYVQRVSEGLYNVELDFVLPIHIHILLAGLDYYQAP